MAKGRVVCLKNPQNDLAAFIAAFNQLVAEKENIEKLKFELSGEAQNQNSLNQDMTGLIQKLDSVRHYAILLNTTCQDGTSNYGCVYFEDLDEYHIGFFKHKTTGESICLEADTIVSDDPGDCGDGCGGLFEATASDVGKQKCWENCE